MTAGVKLPPRLAAVLVPVWLAGFAVAVVAAASFATSPRDPATLAGIASLLAAAVLADRYPVPLDGIDTGGVSLLFVFLVATIVLFGWEAGVLVAVVAAVLQMTQHRPPMRVLYNAAVLALAGGAAGIALIGLHGQAPLTVFAAVVVAAVTHYLVNLLLISTVLAAGRRARPRGAASAARARRGSARRTPSARRAARTATGSSGSSPTRGRRTIRSRSASSTSTTSSGSTTA